MERLLALGSDPHFCGDGAASAMQMAEQSGHTNLRMIILSHLHAKQEEEMLAAKDDLVQVAAR